MTSGTAASRQLRINHGGVGRMSERHRRPTAGKTGQCRARSSAAIPLGEEWLPSSRLPGGCLCDVRYEVVADPLRHYEQQPRPTCCPSCRHGDPARPRVEGKRDALDPGLDRSGRRVHNSNR